MKEDSLYTEYGKEPKAKAQYKVRLFIHKFRYTDSPVTFPHPPLRTDIIQYLISTFTEGNEKAPLDYIRKITYIIYIEGNEELATFENSRPLFVEESLN